MEQLKPHFTEIKRKIRELENIMNEDVYFLKHLKLFKENFNTHYEALKKYLATIEEEISTRLVEIEKLRKKRDERIG